MSTAPVADQHRLLDVQALDTRLAQLAHAVRTHPTRATVDDLAGRLVDVAAALVESQTRASDLRRELAKAEQDVEQVRQRATRDQARLDSGSASVKDVQALSSELEALGRRQGALEEVELEVMERLEAHESALAELTTAHTALVEQQEAATAAMSAALEELEAEAERVRTERAEQVEGLDEALVARYERLRLQLSGLAVAALRGRRCEGCRLELNPTDVSHINAAPPEQVVTCEECGRILIRDAAS